MLINECATCRRCQGAAYQAPPALFAGNLNSPVLVIGQNPGEIRASDIERLDRAAALTVADDISAWYEWDFGTSYGHRILSRIFGSNWLSRYCWTNAVRCRTPHNAMPSSEMITNCRHWTNQLTETRRAWIPMGRVALDQLMLDLEWGHIVYNSSLDLYVLPIRHYSNWRGNDLDQYKRKVEELWEQLTQS